MRLSSFISTLTSMIANLGESKEKRKNSIHNKLLPKNNKQQKSKLTFQMIGSYVKKDRLYE